jgi:carbon monoxide dehydrogenase subunit G
MRASREDATHFLQEAIHMASIHKDIPIDAQPDDVWAAVRDFGSPHQRLVPGFVLDAHLDGDARIVTFANGTVARELLVDCDDARRRLVYAVVSERVKQHSASVQVVADGEARSRLIWIVDVLPNEIAGYIESQMDQAALSMQKALARSVKAESGFASDRAATR